MPRTITGFLVFLIGFPLPALAVEDVIPVSVTKSECSNIVRHVAADDVKYKPGVDVRGKRVVGASTKGDGGFRFKTPDSIEFDLSISPLNAGIAGGQLGETTATVGKVKYDIMKRQITVDGKPLGDQEAAELAERCKAAGFR
jgi:hypothetical protein